MKPWVMLSPGKGYPDTPNSAMQQVAPLSRWIFFWVSNNLCHGEVTSLLQLCCAVSKNRLIMKWNALKAWLFLEMHPTLVAWPGLSFWCSDSNLGWFLTAPNLFWSGIWKVRFFSPFPQNLTLDFIGVTKNRSRPSFLLSQAAVSGGREWERVRSGRCKQRTPTAGLQVWRSPNSLCVLFFCISSNTFFPCSKCNTDASDFDGSHMSL